MAVDSDPPDPVSPDQAPKKAVGATQRDAQPGRKEALRQVVATVQGVKNPPERILGVQHPDTPCL
jgi:hypothetical protein